MTSVRFLSEWRWLTRTKLSSLVSEKPTCYFSRFSKLKKQFINLVVKQLHFSHFFVKTALYGSQKLKKKCQILHLSNFLPKFSFFEFLIKKAPSLVDKNSIFWDFFIKKLHFYETFLDFFKKSPIWWPKVELKRHLVARTCIFWSFFKKSTIFARFVQKKRHLVAKICIYPRIFQKKAPSGGQKLHFSEFFKISEFSPDFFKKSAIWWPKIEPKRHLVARTCIFLFFWKSAIWWQKFAIFKIFSKNAPSGGQKLN